MRSRVLIDTGPLVAIFSNRDHHHEQCSTQLHELSPPLWTCWPVLTEAAWLLRHQPAAVRALLGSFDSGFLRILELGESALPWISRFLNRYAVLRPQLADASLVYLAEREGIRTVFTLDRRDFTVYRLSQNRALNLLPATR